MRAISRWSGVQGDFLDGNGVDRADHFTLSAADSLAPVDREPVVVQRVGPSLYHAGGTGGTPLLFYGEFSFAYRQRRHGMDRDQVQPVVL